MQEERKQNRPDLKRTIALVCEWQRQGTSEEDEGDNKALTLCVVSQQSSTHVHAAHVCACSNICPLFPPNQPLVSHPRFLSFPFVLSRALSRSRCVIWANAVRHLCLSRCFSRVTPVYSIAMCACQRMIAIKSEQRCLGWAPVCWITKWLFGKKKKKMLCYVFYKGRIWNIQNSVVFLGRRTSSPVTETVTGITSGDQRTMTSYYSLCVFSSTFSLLLSHFPPSD